MITREVALDIVEEYVQNINLIRHMLSVEAAMRLYAPKYGGDVEIWGLSGLLHDYDWEIHPTLDLHPQAGIDVLQERGVPDEVIRAILSHADHTGVPRDSTMEKCLAACDEITGLITAVALVRPSRSLYDLTPSSVKKKWKDRSFAAGADRTEITNAVEAFGVEMWEHVGNVITAMQGIAAELDLEGNLKPAE